MSKRKAWNTAMVATGQAPARRVAKRTSTRVTVVSKAMRVVDDETRMEVRDAMLDKLEADNYVEPQGTYEEDDYLDEEDEDRPARKAQRVKGPKPKGNWVILKTKTLAQVVMETLGDDPGTHSPTAPPTYWTCAADPSTVPPRHFCSVCGYEGTYTCVRCGLHFCCLSCNNKHKEVRCLKFSA